jgi:PBSX family phage terminase large subunit
MKQPVFHFEPFSRKQRQILNWWCDDSPVKNHDGIIADGAIRSGKSLSMSLSFVLWAMTRFNNQNFAMCGKTGGSFRRNVLGSLKVMLTGRGYKVNDSRSENLLTVQSGDRLNYFYIFGGRDERSQDLIQGITLAGVFLDEVALMPESFVNQATGRCSVDGSAMWFNCNPSFPSHWFKKQWVDKHDDKNLLFLHFTMDDNLSLSESVKKRYESMYTGVFYDRYIRGLWVLAEGIIYPMYKEAIETPPEGNAEQYVLSLDYGTQNAFAALLWGKYGGVWYAIKEYYYSGRDEKAQKTDEEYAKDLDEFTKDIPMPLKVIIDPSAASFITLLRKRKFGDIRRYRVVPADNAVLDGIRESATAMQLGKIKISPKCTAWRKEAEGYVWDDKATEDRPVKVNDHAMDAMRYFVKTMRIAVPKNRLPSLLYGDYG